MISGKTHNNTNFKKKKKKQPGVQSSGIKVSFELNSRGQWECFKVEIFCQRSNLSFLCATLGQYICIFFSLDKNQQEKYGIIESKRGVGAGYC